MIELAGGTVALLVLLFMRVPLGFAMLIVGAAGVGLTRSWPAALMVTSSTVFDVATRPEFTVLPLFMLMGAFVSHARLSDDLYDAANAWMGHFRGGLAMSTVAASGGFAAISGNSVATALTMAKVALPSMRRYNYSDSFAAGTVAAGGTLGILIPPSAALILYGLLSETDIGALFIAGIIPGIITVILYMAAILAVVHFRPHMGPAGARSAWVTRFRLLARVWGVVVLFLMILGGISFGVFTPFEAGAMGATGALAFALLRGKINWRILFLSLYEAGLTTAMLFTVVFGALMLNQFIQFSGVARMLAQCVMNLDAAPIYALLVVLLIYVFLGMFVEGLAMILLTVPIFAPVMSLLGFDLIWFGIVVVVVVEISLITPPIGLNVFVLKSVLPDVPLTAIFKGILPFFVTDIVRLLLIVFVPALALYLPSVLG